MKTLSGFELERRIKENKPDPLYLLLGTETYQRDAAARMLTEKALAGTLLREFNEVGFSLITDSATDAIIAAEQLPMMSERRVIRIKHFSKLREMDEEILIRYLENPASSSVVIFIADDLHKGKRLSKVLMDKCVVVDYPPLRDNDARQWAESKLRSLKVTIDKQALNQLVDLSGTDLQTLNSEIDKLSTAVINDGHITRDLVDNLIGRSRELSNWDLGNQLVAGDRKRALQTLHRLLEDDVPEVLLLGLIASNYHKLALAKELLNRGARNEALRMVPSFRQKEFIATLEKSSSEKLASGLKKIAAADLAIKTSQGTPRLQLEFLVSELAGN